MRDTDQGNIVCLDCKSNLATHASVTFGIYICEECAEMHQHILGSRLSYIKSLFKPSAIADANWDEYLLKFMENGGNY